MDRAEGQHVLGQHGFPSGGLGSENAGSDDRPVEIGVQANVSLGLVLLDQRLLKSGIGLRRQGSLGGPTADAGEYQRWVQFERRETYEVTRMIRSQPRIPACSMTLLLPT